MKVLLVITGQICQQIIALISLSITRFANRYLPSTEPDLTEYDRNSICQEIVSFISKMACEIQDLNRQLEHIIKETGQETVPGQFYKFIVSSLLSVRFNLFELLFIII